MEQIITEEGKLVDDIEEHVRRIGIGEAGLDYHMLAIIGCQSSGKSTLLNLLFGTRFQTMNEDIGRQQTTKGIHAACAKENRLLVFDVEGSDSRERGDADSLFERKAALFALALSEILIVNMWETDIGRYNAANLPMLRTVFDVNIQLFQAQARAKSTLFFIVRDYTTDNFEALCQNIHNDMAMIWNEITLPPEFQGMKITDFFDFKFYATHHMKMQKEIFDQDIEKLRHYFLDPKSPDYLFEENSSKLVPGDGLAQYITSLWEVINDNKELDIPSQRSMLSHFKCEENIKIIVSGLLEGFTSTVQKPINKGNIMDDFRDICEAPIARAFSEYKENTWRYIPEIVEEKQEDMKKQISEFLYPLFYKNCSMFSSQLTNEFIQYLDEQGEEFKENQYWTKIAQEKKDDITNRFKEFVEKNIVPPFEWEFDIKSLSEPLDELLESRKTQLIDALHQTICSSNQHDFEEESNEILKNADPKMWLKLRETLSKFQNRSKEQISKILSSNVPGAKPNNNIDKQFEVRIVEMVKEAADSQYIRLKMKSAFDKKFKLDDKGRPRVWTDAEDIEAIFGQARDAGFSVLRLFKHCALRDANVNIPNDPLKFVLITSEQDSEISESYLRMIEHSKEEAQSAKKAQAAQNQIPPLAWIFLILIGGDKILKYATNPIIFMLLLFFGGGYALISQLGLTDLVKEKLQEQVTNILNKIQGIQDTDEDGDGEGAEEEDGEADPDSQQPNRPIHRIRNEKFYQSGVVQKPIKLGENITNDEEEDGDGDEEDLSFETNRPPIPLPKAHIVKKTRNVPKSTINGGRQISEPQFVTCTNS